MICGNNNENTNTNTHSVIMGGSYNKVNYGGQNSIIVGKGLFTAKEASAIFGKYNKYDGIFVIGNGTDENNRNDLLRLTSNGYFYLDGKRISTRPLKQSLLLEKDDWSDKEQKVLVTLSEADLNEIVPALSSLDEWGACQVLPIIEESTGITFKCTTVPANDLIFDLISTEVRTR